MGLDLAAKVGSVGDLRTGGRWFKPQARPIFFPRIDDSHCDKINSSLAAVHCFENSHVGKQLVAWKEYCDEYWSKIYRKAWIGALVAEI